MAENLYDLRPALINILKLLLLIHVQKRYIEYEVHGSVWNYVNYKKIPKSIHGFSEKILTQESHFSFESEISVFWQNFQ